MYGSKSTMSVNWLACLALLFSCSASLSAQEKPETSSELKSFNCGLNCALVVMSRLVGSEPLPAESIAADLGIGRYHSDLANFQSLIRVFEKHALRTLACRAPNVNLVVQELNPQNVAILQIKNRPGFHFLAVHRGRDGEIVVDDYPKLGTRYTQKDFEKKLAPDFTGAVLFVSKDAASLS